MSDPILVWGAGAIGGALGAAFQKAGERVVFVDADSAHVEAMRTKGLHVTGPLVDWHLPVEAHLPDDVEGQYARVVLAVKAHHTRHAMDSLLPHLAADGFVLSAQNGLNERVIADAAGPERVMGCFVNFGADYLEPGIVHYSGRGAVVVGEVGGRVSERAVAMHQLLLCFDERAVLTRNIEGYLWGKLVYGALLFATAATNDSIADVLAEPRHRPVLTALAHEVCAVAAAEGVAMEAFDGFEPGAFLRGVDPDVTRRSFDDMVAHNRRSAKSHSGIWRDLAVRKRRTEVDAQLGAVVEHGARNGVPTPLSSRLVSVIHEIEEGARALDAANLDELDRLLAAEGIAS